MSEQLTNTQVTDVESEIKERKDNIYRSYNYVGTKETIAYLFNDWSNTFNIGGWNTRYIWAVVIKATSIPSGIGYNLSMCSAIAIPFAMSFSIGKFLI